MYFVFCFITGNLMACLIKMSFFPSSILYHCVALYVSTFYSKNKTSSCLTFCNGIDFIYKMFFKWNLIRLFSVLCMNAHRAQYICKYYRWTQRNLETYTKRCSSLLIACSLCLFIYYYYYFFFACQWTFFICSFCCRRFSIRISDLHLFMII